MDIVSEAIDCDLWEDSKSEASDTTGDGPEGYTITHDWLSQKPKEYFAGDAEEQAIFGLMRAHIVPRSAFYDSPRMMTMKDFGLLNGILPPRLLEVKCRAEMDELAPALVDIRNRRFNFMILPHKIEQYFDARRLCFVQVEGKFRLHVLDARILDEPVTPPSTPEDKVLLVRNFEDMVLEVPMEHWDVGRVFRRRGRRMRETEMLAPEDRHLWTRAIAFHCFIAHLVSRKCHWSPGKEEAMPRFRSTSIDLLKAGRDGKPGPAWTAVI